MSREPAGIEWHLLEIFVSCSDMTMQANDQLLSRLCMPIWFADIAPAACESSSKEIIKYMPMYLVLVPSSLHAKVKSI